MFQTVRHWWGDGRGKVTLRLFLFELTVVVIGVLIAQTLANYVQHRSEIARMEAERSRIRFELTDTHSAFQTWGAAVPCLNQRMTEVMTGKDFAPNALRRPSFVTSYYVPPTTDTLELIARRYGTEHKINLSWIAARSDAVRQANNVIRDKWGRLMLVDPANGPVTAADRAEARLAAADIKVQLRRIEGLATDVAPLFRKLGIGARDMYTPDQGPARSCAAIWNSGKINPPLTMR